MIWKSKLTRLASGYNEESPPTEQSEAAPAKTNPFLELCFLGLTFQETCAILVPLKEDHLELHLEPNLDAATLTVFDVAPANLDAAEGNLMAVGTTTGDVNATAIMYNSSTNR